MESTEHDKINNKLNEFKKRILFVRKIRPMFLADLIGKIVFPNDFRVMCQTSYGVKLYVNPLSVLGVSMTSSGTYEVNTAKMISENLPIGGSFFDFGANEGVFSAYAGLLVGSKGLVVACEPQSNLWDIIQINCALNGVSCCRLFKNAVGKKSGDIVQINLYPSLNTGASSIVRKYRFSTKIENVKVISPADIFRLTGVDRVDLIKIDVEGYEPEIIEALIDLCIEGRIKTLLIDYHKSILKDRGINPIIFHNQVINTGMSAENYISGELSGYVLYKYRN